jgi:hypothetical protein
LRILVRYFKIGMVWDEFDEVVCVIMCIFRRIVTAYSYINWLMKATLNTKGGGLS